MTSTTQREPQMNLYPAEDRIPDILSGSCTPASDLLALVERGEIRLMVARQRYMARYDGTLTEGAECESEYQRRMDV